MLAGSHIRQYLWPLDRKTRHDALPAQGFHFGQLLTPIFRPPTDKSIHLEYDAYDARLMQLEFHFANGGYGVELGISIALSLKKKGFITSTEYHRGRPCHQ